ncbi:MAG: hypothetical protein ABL962_20475, partial [Fimbriimonadaceae bacterium]
MNWSAILGLRRIGAIAVIALACYWVATGIIGDAKHKDLKRDQSGRDYVTRALPELLTYWDFPALESRAAGELKASRDFENIRSVFKRAKKTLGGPVKYGPIIGGVTDVFQTDYSGEIVTAVYTQKVHFKFEQADIVMSIVKREGGWKFQKLAVRSPA